MLEKNIDSTFTILFVDDEESILRCLRRLFMDEPYEVLTATSGPDAVKLLEERKDIGLIVSDQMMPGMTGVEFLEKAKDTAPMALRIILTGYADGKAAMDAINRSGAYRFITKPWDDEDLLQIVGDAAQRYRLLTENLRLNELVRGQNEQIKKWNSELEQIVQEQTIEIQNKNKNLERLNARLKNNFINIIKSFSLLYGLRDESAPHHSKNVAELSTRVAGELGLPGGEVGTISVASMLHDTGMMGASDIVLLTDPERMTEEEYKEYMLHPVRGQTAVDAIEDMHGAGILIRHHHERWDGKGFPDNLEGNNIPAGARVIAIADFIDNAVRKSAGEEAITNALGKTKERLGKEFDPGLYPLFEKAAMEYYTGFLAGPGAIEKELRPGDLHPGMVVSRDSKSGSGLLLLSKGIELNRENIIALNRV